MVSWEHSKKFQKEKWGPGSSGALAKWCQVSGEAEKRRWNARIADSAGLFCEIQGAEWSRGDESESGEERRGRGRACVLLIGS